MNEGDNSNQASSSNQDNISNQTSSSNTTANVITEVAAESNNNSGSSTVSKKTVLWKVVERSEASVIIGVNGTEDTKLSDFLKYPVSKMALLVDDDADKYDAAEKVSRGRIKTLNGKVYFSIDIKNEVMRKLGKDLEFSCKDGSIIREANKIIIPVEEFHPSKQSLHRFIQKDGTLSKVKY